MALLGWELRKIWRPALLAAIALIGLVFWQIRTEFYIEHLGSSWEDEIGLANRWLEEYGTTIEPAERSELDGQLAEAKETFSAQVTQIDGAAEAGVRDWPSWLAWEEQYHDDTRADRERDRDLYWAVQYDTNLGEIEALETFLERYDRLAAGDVSALGDVTDWPPQAAERQARRLEEAAARPEAFGFLPGSNTDDFFHYFAIWCSFSAALLLAPALVRDRLRRTRAMQWAARRGRGTLGAQMGAALLSGVLLTLVNFAVYLGPFLSTGALTFWNCPMTSVWAQTVPWFDWTYGQYVLALCGLTVALALATSGVYRGPLLVQRCLCGHAAQAPAPGVRAGVGAGALGHGGGGHLPGEPRPAAGPARRGVGDCRPVRRPGPAAVRPGVPAAAAARPASDVRPGLALCCISILREGPSAVCRRAFPPASLVRNRKTRRSGERALRNLAGFRNQRRVAMSVFPLAE